MEALPLQGSSDSFPLYSAFQSICSISKGPKEREGIPPFQPTCKEKVIKVLQGVTNQEMCLSCARESSGTPSSCDASQCSF